MILTRNNEGRDYTEVGSHLEANAPVNDRFASRPPYARAGNARTRDIGFAHAQSATPWDIVVSPYLRPPVP